MPPTPTSRRAVNRARTLIELMMKEMHAALRDPDRLTPEQWDKLFGAKQSMIANLHKLVATLMALPDANPKTDGIEMDPHAPVSAQELEMLTSWLSQEEA